MSSTVERVPLPRHYIEMFPLVVVGGVYLLGGIFAHFKGSELAIGWRFSLLGGVFLLLVVGYQLYTSSPEKVSMSNRGLILQYVVGAVIVLLYIL